MTTQSAPVLFPRLSTATPHFLELVGSSRASIEAYAVAELCSDLERIDAGLRDGDLPSAQHAELRNAVLERNARVWGRYSPASQPADR